MAMYFCGAAPVAFSQGPRYSSALHSKGLVGLRLAPSRPAFGHRRHVATVGRWYMIGI